MNDLSISNFLMIDECLLDVRRVEIFKNAIQKVIRPEHIVVDAGTGTGIMALFAARYGAKKVYAVERDPEIAVIAKKNIAANKLENQIEVVNCDVREFKLPAGEHADVLIMEMLDTGLVAEQQGQALVALRKNGVIDEKTILLPEKMDFLFSLVNYDFDFYGFHIPVIIQARNYGATKRIKEHNSKLLSYGIIDLSSIDSPVVDSETMVVVEKDGIINAVELRSYIYLAGRRYSDTSDMNMPVIVPIEERKVSVGDKIKLKIHYNMGHGFADFKIKIL